MKDLAARLEISKIDELLNSRLNVTGTTLTTDVSVAATE
jgi:hypothetical protein